MKQKSAVVKTTQVISFYGFMGPRWVELSESVRLTGRCRRINGIVEKEVEFISTGVFGLKNSEFGWRDDNDFRTVEYFQCDEKK